MSSVNKLQFESMLISMVEQGGSDLHLTAGNFPMMRVVGNLTALNQEILTGNSIEELLLPLLNLEQNNLLKQNKAIILSYSFSNGLRFKINLFYQKGSLAADLHHISSHLKPLNELGLSVNIEQVANINQGLLIVAGPFQSGKTTTAMAILEQINQIKEAKILTLEEPIEYFLTNAKSIIQQREVGRDTPSLKEGLRDALKVNADVIFITEISDKEEFELILELAEQGRLVITVITAESSLSVLMKIFSYFNIEEKIRFREIFSRVLKVVICQKLLVGLDNKMVVANEILINNDAVRLSIQSEKLNQINNILRTSLDTGMISFEQTISQLVKSGQISAEEAHKHSEETRELERLLRS